MGALLRESTFRAQRAVNLGGGDLDEPADSVAAGGIQQDAGAGDIGVNKILRRIDAPVLVRFGGEVDDGEELMLPHQLVHEVGVRDVRVEKFIPLAVLGGEAGGVPNIGGVGERIHIGDELRVIVFEDVADEVAADKAAAAGH